MRQAHHEPGLARAALSAALERLSAGLAIAPAPRPRLASIEREPGPFAEARRHADLTRRAGRQASRAGLQAIESTVLARAAILRSPRRAAATLSAADPKRIRSLIDPAGPSHDAQPVRGDP